jgi:hypothetical protein
MSKVMIKSAFTVGLLFMLLVASVAGASVNKSVKIDAGSESDGASSVNGSVTVGDGAVVSGSVDTVNGKVRVGNDARIENAKTVNGSVSLDDNVIARDLETVNGSISIGQGGDIRGDVGTVNGRISLERRTVVAGDVGNVNGDMEFEGSEVGGNVTTTNGNIYLKEAAVVKGDILIEKPSFWNFGDSKNRKPEIVIGPGSVVGGKIRLEREVELYISDTAEVGGVEGEMSMNEAVRFSGDRP